MDRKFMLIRTDSAAAFYSQNLQVPKDDFTELQLHQFADDRFWSLILRLFHDVLRSL